MLYRFKLEAVNAVASERRCSFRPGVASAAAGVASVATAPPLKSLLAVLAASARFPLAAAAAATAALLAISADAAETAKQNVRVNTYLNEGSVNVINFSMKLSSCTAHHMKASRQVFKSMVVQVN